jgi:hypothetical protein
MGDLSAGGLLSPAEINYDNTQEGEVMKLFTKITFLLMCCFLLIAVNLRAQEKITGVTVQEVEVDQSIFKGTPEAIMVAPPPDTTNMPTATNDIWYTNKGSDRYIWLDWLVTCNCFWGCSSMRITVYQNGAQIYYTNISIGYLIGWQADPPWQLYNGGPNTTYTYAIVRRNIGPWGCDNSWSKTINATTAPLKPPVSVTASNANSDKDVALSWANSSDNPVSQYTIHKYEGSTLLETKVVNSTSHTYANRPHLTANKTYTYKIQAMYGSHRAMSAGANAEVKAYKPPTQFTASRDLIPWRVHLTWQCPSDYATHVRIYRDGELLITLPKSQTSYDDYSAEPNKLYSYRIASYNINDDYESNFNVEGDNQAGEVFGQIGHLLATDGTRSDKVQLNWNDFTVYKPDFYSQFHLYRDGELITDPNVLPTGYNDFDAVPGKIHKYKINLVKNQDTVLSIIDYGFRPANGSIEGKVVTSTQVGVPNIELRVWPESDVLSKALSLDGIDDYVSSPALALNSNTITISAWIKRKGAPNDFDGIIYNRTGSTASGLHIMANGELRYNWNNMADSYNWDSGLIAPDNEWTFVALVVEPDKATLYMNDTSVVNTLAHMPAPFDGPLDIGRDSGAADRYFSGVIDEVAVWSEAHTSEQIMANQHRIFSGDEEGLEAYWRFSMGSGTVAGDYAVGGNHHAAINGAPSWVDDIPTVWHYALSGYPQFLDGDFRIYNIYWGDGGNFTIMPFKEKHGFKPDSLIKPLNTQKFQWEMQDGIRFTDTTSIAVSGFVYLASDPPCPVPNVEMLVDDEETMLYTDSTGHFSVTVGEAGTYKLGVSYFDHKFTPADTTLDVIDAITGLVFWDSTTSKLSGKVVGVCDNYLGEAQVKITSLVSGCIDTTVITDDTGYYEVTLPAQEYIAQVYEIDSPDRVSILNYLTPDTINITEEGGIADFIYHTPPIMTLSGIPDEGCAPYDVPITYQEDGFRLKIDITEKFGNLECPTDTGSIHILDKIAYSTTEKILALENGSTFYDVIPGYPNLSGGGEHPHQKMMVIKADVAGYTVSDTIWVLVLGQKPREFEFSTVTPEIPLMILRDPPGDMSYSYLSKETTSSVNIGFSFESEVGVGIFTKFKVGGGGDIPGVGSTGAWVGGEAEANIGIRSTLEGTQEIVISTSEMLKTSDSDAIIGADGDVYMGAAINLLYAKTDILDYDSDNCTVVRDTGIVWNGDGFKTTYLYTESHIRESVIPGLKSMAAVLNATGIPAKQDSAEVILNQVDVWQQVLDYNASLKEDAVPLPGFPENISLSAGTNISNETTISSKQTLSMGLALFIDASVAVSIGAKVGDFNEGEAGVKIFSRLEIGVSAEVSYEVTNTIGFELADDDADPPGDVFTIDVLGDPVYGTPVFKLLGGKSSCPWEPGTMAREAVGLTMNTFELSNIPPEIPAAFDLYLYNLSQADETRSYLLSLVQGSNPDGAVISIGGAVLGDDQLQFTMPPNRDDPQKATLRVERVAGSAFDYENLQVHLYSPCDDKIDTTTSFSVHFIKPCSDVSIAQPARHWRLNTTSDSTLVIVLKDYDKNDSQMSELKCEYRLKDAADWTQLFAYTRSQLPNDSIRYEWDMAEVKQGEYELRALTICSAGTFYTGTHFGMTDFLPPVAFGKPEPADGSLDAGDDISVELSEVIDCATVNSQNVSLINTTKNLLIDIDVLCKDDRIVIEPKNPEDMVEGDSMEVIISSLADLAGNVIEHSIIWEFEVNIISLVPDKSEPELPTAFALDQNYPNPFNPETMIRFAIPQAIDVEMIIYDVTGKVLMKPVKEHLVPGYYNVIFDGSHLASGVYFYHLKAGTYKQTRKLILLK